MPKKWMCPECRELCATELWCWYCGETLCWELKPEDAAWLDRMPGSDKGENMNPDETGVSSKPTEKGNKMLWDKRDMPKKPYYNVKGKPSWMRSAAARWLGFNIEEF